MRGDLAKREPLRFTEWDRSDLYQQTLDHREGCPTYILHDGPPYANGNIHMGHALNKVLKDFVIRYKCMQGHRTPYVPGWDCHGLPIEQQILRQIGDRLHEMEAVELRNLCHRYAVEWIGKQRTQFKRLGILGDWERPYSTVSHEYEVGILQVLLSLLESGLIRKGHKAVHWDPVFRTALAEAEIEYHPHQSPSIYVAMALRDPSAIAPIAHLDSVSIVIWTTTPWTIPANLGISLHPDFQYVAIRDAGNRHFVIAEGRLDAFLKDCPIEGAEVVATFKATEFDRALAQHPIFPDKDSLIMLGDHVTLEQGTGCVHTAPGHGADDFVIGKAYGLPVFCPVDHRGCYTEEFPLMQGEFVFDANPKIVQLLKDLGCLLGAKTITHEYPHSERSGSPILFRATEQWFMQLPDEFRNKALHAIDHDVEWIPQWGRDRISGMVERRPEWCISRQRKWGVPIPSVRNRRTGESQLLPGLMRKFIDAVAESGTDAWYCEPLAHFLPDGFNEDDYEKEFDILDVWFDSGASHLAVLELDDRLSSPADLYLEGSDQHRGWFQHALLTAIGVTGRAPFKSVLTHGFVLDAQGKAMSKSKGNVISPLDLIDQFGSDILRLWVASTDYRNDVSISKEIVTITADTYRTIRNTFRFQLGNLYDFNPKEHLLAPEQLTPLDQWALHELSVLIDEATEAFNRFEFHRVYQQLNRFFTVTLSARYHDFLKDRLYTLRYDCQERRSAQTVIYHQFHALIRMMAPFLVFTAEEAFEQAPGYTGQSIHMEDWPQVPENWRNLHVASEISQLLDLRDPVNEQLEALRARKEIGKSIEAALQIKVNSQSPLCSILENHSGQLAELFIVSTVAVVQDDESDPIQFSVMPAGGVRCPRCWRTVPALVNVPLQPESAEVCPRCASALAEA